ncbi:MAG: BMP family ABC transporter substrate-binding protein [Acidimicrobiia bacterium]
MRQARSRRWALVLALALVIAACGADEGTTTTTAAGETTTTGEAPAAPLTFGMILVGPQDDRGWSQAHREAGEYVEEMLGATMIVIDKVNPADRPDTPLTQIVDDMIDQGAQLIFATSDDMKDGILEAAAAHPDVPMIWSSGDSAWEDGKAFAGLDNLGNVMGEMEYGKMIAGCAAALKSETGSIGYVGPLINDETRRLVNAAYLGAKHCWEEYRGGDAAELTFAVNWIGFWFQIPGVTLDPTQVTNEFLDGGADVVISGIDTTEALVRTGQRAAAGENVWAIPYDYEGACEEAPEICLGVPYFHWGPAYLDIARSVQEGTFTAEWQWLGPDWSDINNPDTSIVGFVNGEGLGEAEADLDAFIAELAGGLELWTGPLNYQDGSAFLAEGEAATEFQVWYMPQLLEGVIGASS